MTNKLFCRDKEQEKKGESYLSKYSYSLRHIFSKYVTPVALVGSVSSATAELVTEEQLCLPPRSFFKMTERHDPPAELHWSRQSVAMPMSFLIIKNVGV